MTDSTKATSDKKWFIDCNGVIRSIPIDPTEQDEYVLNADEGLVYHVAWDGGVFDEYVIWNTLHELADAIEPMEQNNV